MRGEVLLERHRALGPRGIDVRPDAGALGAPAGEHRDARRAAHRDRHVGPVEADAARGEAVDGRRLHRRAPGADLRVEVVDEDQQHVAPGRSGPAAGLRRARRSRLERVAHLLDGRAVLGARREVRDLAGVRVVVVELAAAVGPLRVAPAGGARAAADAAGPPRDRRERLRPSRGRRVGEKRHQAPPGEAGLGGEAGEGEERRRRVQRRDEAARGPAGARQPGSRHHERRAQRVVEESVRPSEKAVARPGRAADRPTTTTAAPGRRARRRRRETPASRSAASERSRWAAAARCRAGSDHAGGRTSPPGRSVKPRSATAMRGSGGANEPASVAGGGRPGAGPGSPPTAATSRNGPELRAQPLLEARGHGLLADSPGKVEVPLGGLEGERAAGAHARDRRAPRPEERGDRALAGAEQGGAGGARLGIGSERRLEGASRGEPGAPGPESAPPLPRPRSRPRARARHREPAEAGPRKG